ncbi:MAG: winged helix-turn-helix domain-containing protein [Thermodesulfobacteriota bacterium]
MKKRKKNREQPPAPQEGLRCRGRVWVEKDVETFIGFGRVVLLEKIREHGSISRAAQAMQMSYRHAWKLVDSMNRHAGSPLVVASKGGSGGGGAQVTAEGERMIDRFAELRCRLDRFLVEQTALLFR